jgi:hypothetical protein
MIVGFEPKADIGLDAPSWRLFAVSGRSASRLSDRESDALAGHRMSAFHSLQTSEPHGKRKGAVRASRSKHGERFEEHSRASKGAATTPMRRPFSPDTG